MYFLGCDIVLLVGYAIPRKLTGKDTIMRTFKSIPKSGKLHDAMNDGQEFRKYCLLFGEIIGDKEYDNERGFYRMYTIKIQGLIANIEMHNGEVIRWGLKL